MKKLLNKFYKNKPIHFLGAIASIVALIIGFFAVGKFIQNNNIKNNKGYNSPIAIGNDNIQMVFTEKIDYNLVSKLLLKSTNQNKIALKQKVTPVMVYNAETIEISFLLSTIEQKNVTIFSSDSFNIWFKNLNNSNDLSISDSKGGIAISADYKKLISNRWYILKFVHDERRAWIYLDGELCGYTDAASFKLGNNQLFQGNFKGQIKS